MHFAHELDMLAQTKLCKFACAYGSIIFIYMPGSNLTLSENDSLLQIHMLAGIVRPKIKVLTYLEFLAITYNPRGSLNDRDCGILNMQPHIEGHGTFSNGSTSDH